MKEPFTGTEAIDHLGFRIELHPMSMVVPISNGPVQGLHRIGGRIVMVVFLGYSLFESLDEVVRWCHIRVPQAEIDHISSLSPHHRETLVHDRAEISIEIIESP